MQHSALFRAASYALAHRRIQAFGHDDTFKNPLLDIGLPDIGIGSRLVGTAAGANLNEWALGRRVSDAERIENLTRLVELSRSHGFELILMHPSYAASQPHTCALTRFAAEHDLPLFEAQPSLHGTAEPGRYFVDPMHPNRDGHERLAQDLAAFIREQHLGPTPRPRRSARD